MNQPQVSIFPAEMTIAVPAGYCIGMAAENAERNWQRTVWSAQPDLPSAAY